jgi:hypothetical protein
MLHRKLPGHPQAVEDARAWIKAAISARHPKISIADAVQVGGELVAAAVRRTPEGGVVEINLIPARNGGLVIKVKDPDSPTSPHRGIWAKISLTVRDFGASASAEGGHIAWCELPEVAAP